MFDSTFPAVMTEVEYRRERLMRSYPRSRRPLKPTHPKRERTFSRLRATAARQA